MTPTVNAALAAFLFTLLLSTLPVDGKSDRSAKHWAPKPWLFYRLKLSGLQMTATAIAIWGAQKVGWAPADDADLITAVVHGVAWSTAAVAVLRAEVPGLNESAPTPGFSFLRAASTHFSDLLTTAITAKVREKYRASTLREAQAAAFRANAQTAPPRDDDAKPTLRQDSYAAVIAEYKDNDRDKASCVELIVKLVVGHHLASVD